MTAKKRGTDASLSRGVAAGALIPLIAARDIKAMRSPGAVFDASDRNILVQTGIPTRFKPSIEFDMIANGGAGFLAIRSAFVAQSAINLVYLDGAPGTGASGMSGAWAVCGFPVEHPLLDGQKVKITLKPHGNTSVNFDLNYTGADTLGTAETPVSKKLGTLASINDSTHAPISAFSDIKLTIENAAEFDSGDRTPQTSADGNSYYIDSVIPTRFKIAAEGKVIWDAGNAQLVAIRTAFLAQSPLQMWVLDGPYTTTGSWGVTSDWAVTDFPMNAPLLDGQIIDLKFEPHGNATHQPTFVTM